MLPVAAAGVAAALCAVVVRQRAPEIALALALAACVVLLWHTLPLLETIKDVLDELADRYGPVPKSVQGLIDISLVRVVAAKLGIYEITQNRDTLILYSDKLDLATLKPLLKDMGRRLLVNASGKPYLSVRILPGEKPLDVMNAVFDKMAELERPQ